MIGQRGPESGQLAEPTGVVVDPRAGSGSPIRPPPKMIRYGLEGSADVELPLPKSGSFNGYHLDVMPDRGALVTDPEGARLLRPPRPGRQDPHRSSRATPSSKPIGVSIAPDGRLVVADVDRHQVVVLSPLAAP